MDYIYNFDSATLNRISITIKKDSFYWPKVALKKNDTILLKLQTKNSWLGKLVYPCIAVNNGDSVTKHYLERNNDGIKYLNITKEAHDAVPESKIILRSKQLSWQENAELYILHNSSPKKPKLLVIAPHPDDAELAAFSLYSQNDSHIVTITAGEGGDARLFGEYSKEKREQHLFKGRTRVVDSITVPMRGNVSPQKSINLGYSNNTLLEMYKTPDKVITSPLTSLSSTDYFRKLNISSLIPTQTNSTTWNNLLSDLVELIKKIKPNIIVLPHPVLDKHPDHLISSLTTFEALKKSGVTEGAFLFYVVHSIHSHKYPYGPAYTPITVSPNDKKLATSHGLYSLQLTHKQQIEKYYALNGMSDLRESPNHVCGVKRVLGQSARRLLGRYNRITPWYHNYRKAVRANELFFTVPFAKIESLIKEAKKLVK